MMKNRLISVVLAISIILGIVPAFASSETETDFREAYALMELLEVFPKISEADTTGGVTRAEFALALARILRVDTTKTSDVRYFTDIAMSHWAHTAVNALVEQKIISQSDDKLFHPDDFVSFNEAVKMMVCTIGYRDYAEAKGGYPYGYIAAANRAKILEGVEGREEFTLGDMLILSANAVCAHMYDISYIENGNLVYDNDSENTILSVYWDIYESEGLCEGVYGLNLSDKKPSEGEAVIDGKIYVAGNTDAEEFVGQYVNYFYRLKKGDTKGELVYVSSEKSKVVEFDAKDFISVISGTVNYFNENGKSDSLKMASGNEYTVVMKNGTTVNKDISLAFNITNGSIKAVDSDGNGRYETVFINSCEIAQATSSDAFREIIYATDIAGKNITISEKQNQILRIKTSQNPNADISAITNNSVLHIYESDNVLTVYVCNNAFSGTLEEVFEDGDNSSVTVNGEQYYVYGYLTEDKKFSPGNSYTFYCDKDGKIAFVGNGNASGMTYGFLHKAIVTEGLDTALSIRIFTENDGVMELSDNGKLLLDGEKTEPADALAHLEKYGVSQLVLFRADADGKLAEIDTRYRGEKESEYTLTCSFEDLAEAIFFTNSGYSKFDRLGTFDTKNLRFIVPNLSILNEAEDKDFIAARSGYFSNNSKFSAVRLYTTNPDNMYDTIALAYSTGASVEHRPMIIDSVTKGLTESGEVLGLVKGIEDGYVNYFISSNYQKEWDALKLGQGDVVIVDTNAYGEIVGCTIKMHYSAGAAQPNGMLSLDASPSQARDLTAGYVLKKVGNDVEWSFGADVATPFERLKIGNDVQIAVFDSAQRVNKVYIGSVNDILDAESVGIENASSIILYAEYNRIGNIILHKRGWDD